MYGGGGCSNSSDNSAALLAALSSKANATLSFDEYKSKLPVAYSKEGDPFNGKKYNYSGYGSFTAEFKDGVLTVKRDRPRTFWYSYDAANKRLYCVFRSALTGPVEDPKSEQNVANLLTELGSTLSRINVTEDSKKALKDNFAIYYSRIHCYSYNQADNGELTLTPYFNGSLSDFAGAKFYKDGVTSFGEKMDSILSDYSAGGIFGFIGFYVSIPANGEGKTSIQGGVTKIDGNKFTCGYLKNENGIPALAGTFAVEVATSPASGNSAVATMKITAIDDAVKAVCGQGVNAQFADMAFTPDTLFNTAWTLQNN